MVTTKNLTQLYNYTVFIVIFNTWSWIKQMFTKKTLSWSQRGGLVGKALAAKPGDLRLIPRKHRWKE